jgi:hypothetical protein
MRMFEAKIVCLWKKSFGRTTEEHSSYNIENDLYTISRTLKGLRSRWTFMGLGGAGAPSRCYYGIEKTICSTLCYFRSLIYENCVSVQSVQPQPRRAASESIFNNFMMKKQIFQKRIFSNNGKNQLIERGKIYFSTDVGWKNGFFHVFRAEKSDFSKSGKISPKAEKIVNLSSAEKCEGCPGLAAQRYKCFEPAQILIHDRPSETR